MLSDEFTQAIKIISKELNPRYLDYALIGSSNLALQGMDISPHDLDFVMKLVDLKKIPEIFKKYSPSDVEELNHDSKDPAWTSKIEKHPAWNVHFNIGNVPVQILGELDDGDYVSKLLPKRLIYIGLDKIKVPCFSLETEAQSYIDTFRPQKAEKIITFLKSQ